MSILNFAVLAVAILAIGIILVLGLFQLTVGNLVMLALVAVAFTYVGIMLARRSETANLYADKIKAEIDEIKARVAAFRRANGLD